MRKLAIITHEYYPVLSGGSVFTDKLSQSLSKMDYDIEILTTGIGKGFPKSEKNSFFTVRRFWTGRKSKHDANLKEHLLFIILGLPRMFFYMAGKKFDILFCVFAIPSGFIGRIIAKFLCLPLFVFVDAADLPGVQSAMHGIVNKIAFIFRYVTKKADGVVILDGLQDIAEPLIMNTNIKIIPNGTIIPSSVANPGSSSGSPIRFLSIGRLVPRKGFKEIIDAFAIVKRQTANFHFTIIGYGTGEKEVRNAIEENKLVNNVTIAGRIEHENLSDYYLNSDCYLFYGDREGSSLAMIEAVSYGLPVIATDHPGNTTYVRNDYNGFIVEHKNIYKLSEAIIKVIYNKDKMPQWGENSQKIAKEYAWDKIAEKYNQVFKSVVNKDSIK